MILDYDSKANSEEGTFISLYNIKEFETQAIIH